MCIAACFSMVISFDAPPWTVFLACADIAPPVVPRPNPRPRCCKYIQSSPDVKQVRGISPVRLTAGVGYTGATRGREACEAARHARPGQLHRHEGETVSTGHA